MKGMYQIMLRHVLLMPLLAACDQQNGQDHQDKTEMAIGRANGRRASWKI